MTMYRALAGIFVLVAGLFGASAAMAAEATANVSLNVRAGPGTGYSVVDVLYDGERVTVERCSGGWCEISHRGPDGWVSARYLTIYDGTVPTRPAPSEPDIGFCVDAPNFSFGINCDPGRSRPARPRSEVCFYEDYGYSGRSFCARPGESDRRLRSWNDRISSIEVIGGASAVVCEDWGFRGRCARVNRSIRALRGPNNDAISSFRVE